MSIRNVDTFVHGEVKVTVLYLIYALVLLLRNCIRYITDHEELEYLKMRVFLSTGTVLPEGRV
jgi:intracellular septation protein A